MNKPASITLAVLLLAPVASLPAEPVSVATSQYARPPQEAWKVELLKQPLRAYCIDFNWLVEGKHVFPEPGHWADASPAAHVKWYKDAGVTCIQTFVLSANGYAWYKGGPVPEQPGLKHDFLPEVVKLGHKERMLVMGYYCIGANTLWGKLHPEQSYGTPSWMHIPLTKEYIEYLCVSVEDALKKTGMDGFMLDWMVNTSGKWLDCEKTMYQELLGIPFPGDDKISSADLEKFNDLAVTRCWTRIRDTARKVKPDCILWPNGINHLKLEGVDWLLNEGPDVETTEAARKELNGRPVRLIQNQVGWSNHDARKVFCDPANRDKDFYGFAAPYDNSLPLPVAEYLKRPVADFNGTSKMTINDRNIAALIRFYLGKPVEPPPPWPEALRCEYLKDPLGIDVAKPRLSWKIEDRIQESEVRSQKTESRIQNPGSQIARGVKQTAYQVLVASSQDLLRKNQGDLWDSGKVESDQSLHVEYAGKPLISNMRCFWKVRVWTSRTEVRGQRSEVGRNGDRSEWSEPAYWTMGMLKPEDPPSPGSSGVTSWSAKWIRSQENDVNVAPWFRKTFELSAVPVRASVCVNIAGYAELYVNGQKVGTDVLTPAVSDHNLQVFYNTYDVTPLLKKGRNAIGLWLGRGWAGGVPLVRAELRAQVDGKPWFLGTDASWKARVSHYRWIGGREWNNFGGERVDANANVPDWNRETFDDSSWTNAVETSALKGEAVAQQAPLNRIGKEIPAVAVNDLGGGRYEIDFGTALTGWLRLKMPAWNVDAEPSEAAKQAGPANLTIIQATYTARDGAGSADVTAKVASLVKDDTLNFEVTSNTLGGDPALNHVKDLVVEYELHGKRRTTRAVDFSPLTIPVQPKRAMVRMTFADKKLPNDNMVGDLTWVKAHHDSPYGRIVSNWKLEAGKLTMEVTVPPNSTATIFVPAKDAASVTESGKPATKAVGVKFLRMENGAAVYAVGSGTYQFQSALIKTAK